MAGKAAGKLKHVVNWEHLVETLVHEVFNLRAVGDMESQWVMFKTIAEALSGSFGQEVVNAF